MCNKNYKPWDKEGFVCSGCQLTFDINAYGNIKDDAYDTHDALMSYINNKIKQAAKEKLYKIKEILK